MTMTYTGYVHNWFSLNQYAKTSSFAVFLNNNHL